MHTQGKWKYCKQITVSATEDQSAQFVYELFEGEKYIGQFKDEDNANRIVQMHNSFDNLLEACEEASAALEAIVSAIVASKEIELNWCHTRKHLTEAIATAKNRGVRA